MSLSAADALPPVGIGAACLCVDRPTHRRHPPDRIGAQQMKRTSFRRRIAASLNSQRIGMMEAGLDKAAAVAEAGCSPIRHLTELDHPIRLGPPVARADREQARPFDALVGKPST